MTTRELRDARDCLLMCPAIYWIVTCAVEWAWRGIFV